MIHVDETDPIGENPSPFPKRTVKIARGFNPEEKFELLRELGRGKFGTVYKCRERATDLHLAAKFVGIPNRGDRRNVEREVDIMNTLQHHLITQLYDAFEYQKMMCVVLELIEGGELFERVIDEDFLLTERACIVFVRQICEALDFVHRNHILHLDLKPENIMCLSREGNRIKIIDFGLARKFDPDKKMQILFGTPEFVAPEVVNFDSIGFGTDMWSVGVICYVLLSGLSPFMGETDVETMGNVTVAKYDFDDEAFNDVSEEALSFITQLLVKEIDKRMTASESLQHQWLRRQPPKRRPLTTTAPICPMDVPEVQLISDLSSLESITNNNIDVDSSPLSESENSESELVGDGAKLSMPPPLPKTAPPPIELLIESSLPIIIPTSQPHHHRGTLTGTATTTVPVIAAPDQLLPRDTPSPQASSPHTTGGAGMAKRKISTDLPPLNGIDKELDLTKDNLKSFVERWDGSQPVEIPKPDFDVKAPKPNNAARAAAATDSKEPKKSLSTSSLGKSKLGKETTSTKNSKRNNEKTVGKSSDFITHEGVDNDTSPAPSENADRNSLPVAANDNGGTKITNCDAGQVSDNDSGFSSRNITKSLLDQLDQIQIKATEHQQPPKEGQNQQLANGVNYLKVDNILESSTPSSTLSSRGCSPSPCESLASTADTQEQQAEDTFDESSPVKAPAGLLRDYLQSFDRRKSDSNYVLGNKNNPAHTEEKIDLADEIRRLSDHLQMLNSYKTETPAAVTNNTQECKSNNTKLGAELISAKPRPEKPISPSSSVASAASCNGSTTTPKLNGTLEKRTKLTDPANLSSKLESKIVKSQIMRFSKTSPNSQQDSMSQTTSAVSQQMAVNNTSTGVVSCVTSMSSVRMATRLIEELHKPQTPISQPPWMLKCKRTKFRMTELSRDVPANAPDSHKTIFIEESATNTKDCLLQLLEKYNHNTNDEFEKRTLDIDRSVIPASTSSSSSSIDSLPPMPVKLKSAGSSVTKTSTQMTQHENGATTMTSTTSKTTTRSATRTTKKTTTTTKSSESSRSATEATNKEVGTTTTSNSNNAAELEGKTAREGDPEFAKSIPRHFSLTLNWDKDNVEETTMNSLNTFFQRHSSHVGSNIVKQIQQQIEAKRVPQK